jgi:hypothetical protein
MESETYDFDECGRMNYDPRFHFAMGKPYTVGELMYLCRFYEHDGVKSLAFALGKPEQALTNVVIQLRKKGMFEYFKNKWDELLMKECL